MKIGIFSGTFDPVHNGHIAFCREAMRACGLSKVLLVPEAKPRGKQHVTPLRHRKAMLDLAAQDWSGIETLTLETPQFTVAETLPELHRLFPQDELTLLLGSDVVRTFAHRWPGLEGLFSDMALAIGLRQDDTQAEVEVMIERLQQACQAVIRYTCVTTPEARVASTHVRNLTHSSEVTDQRVAAYIAKHKLYGAYLKP